MHAAAVWLREIKERLPAARLSRGECLQASAFIAVGSRPDQHALARALVDLLEREVAPVDFEVRDPRPDFPQPDRRGVDVGSGVVEPDGDAWHW